MRIAAVAWLLGCLLALPAQPSDDPVVLGNLLERLGSDEFTTRQKAQGEMLQLPHSILPTLNNLRSHPDPEIRAQIREVLPILENRRRVAETLITNPVRLRYINATLEETIADTAEQTGIALQLPVLSVERRWQRLTLDTGTTTPWAALYQVLDAAGLHIEPAEEIASVEMADETFRARARFQWARRGRSSLPRIEPGPLRLLDGRASEDVVRWIQGPLCIEAGPVPGQRVQYPAAWRELSLPLTFQVEPRFAFSGIAAVLLDEIRDDQGQRLPDSQRMHDAVLGIDYFTIPRHLGDEERGRWWYRRQLALPIQTLARPSRRLDRITGRVLVGLRKPAEDLAQVKLTPGELPRDATPTADGGQLRFTRVENDGEGTWTLEMTLTHPDQGSWYGIGTDTLLDRTGTTNPVRLLDRKGQMIRPAGGLIDNRNANVCVIKINFVATEAQDGPAELIYTGRRPVQIEVPFELRGVPVP